VVADRASLAAALDDQMPGSGAPHEVWADGGGASTSLLQRLAQGPYDRLGVTTRSAQQAALESDAVGQGAATVLLVAAAVSLGVGMLSLVLLVLGERRDDAAALLAQEADGVSTSALRRSLWWRAAGAALPGLVVGTAAGLVLARAVSSLVSLSASGGTPVPPLEPAVGVAWTATVLGLSTAAALAVCGAVAARTLRTDWPVLPDQDLR
jgi:hypothetical protein